MASFGPHGLRGSVFEDFINTTNQFYLDNGLALIQKIPTPITPIEMDKNKGHITLAFFDKKSTVDYIGVVQGIPVCFDAKECTKDTFPLQNIHSHQVEFMNQFDSQSGYAFILIYFTNYDVYYYLTLEKLNFFWERQENGGRKSFRFDELDEDYFFKAKMGEEIVPYLEMLDKDIESRK